MGIALICARMTVIVEWCHNVVDIAYQIINEHEERLINIFQINEQEANKKIYTLSHFLASKKWALVQQLGPVTPECFPSPLHGEIQWPN